MKKIERKETILTIKQLSKQCLDDRKYVNPLIDLAEYLQVEDVAVLQCSITCMHSVYSRFIGAGDMVHDTNTDSSEQGQALSKDDTDKVREQYDNVVDRLLSLLGHETPTVQDLSLSTLMKFVSAEGQHPLQKVTGKHGSFPEKLYMRILSALISSTCDMQKLLGQFQEYLDYDDVRYYTLKAVSADCRTRHNKQTPSDTFLNNMFAVLENVSMTSGDDDVLSNFMSLKPDEGSKMLSVKEHKKLFTGAWVGFLHFRLPASLYRRVLTMLHEKVMPYMTSPLLLSDFFTDSYNIGGAVSLLALNGLFVLVHKYNLDYPHFYRKLYALFEPSIFHVKYRSRFFHLADLFLSSTHLPSYLVAAFVKRLARISLTAPPSGILLSIPFIYNLVNRHPKCRLLISRPDTEYDDDPYNPDEPDPAKCGALDSSLWELKSLQSHYHPDVVKLCQKIDHTLPDEETDLRDLLDVTADDLFEKERNKKFKSAAVTFTPPKGLMGSKDDKLHICWTL